MNTIDEFETALIALLNDEISLDPDVAIGLETDLLLTGLVDSLGVVQVVAWMEDELGASIDPIDVTLDNFQTPERMIVFAKSLL